MKAEIILRVKICQFSQEKTSALWKNFKLKFTLLLLCQQKSFLVEEQISNLKKKNDRGRQEAFQAHPRGENERPICKLCVYYLVNSGRCLSFLPPLFLLPGSCKGSQDLWQIPQYSRWSIDGYLVIRDFSMQRSLTASQPKRVSSHHKVWLH